MVALVGLGDQLVDLAAGNLGQDAVALADRHQNGVEHIVDALHNFAVDPVKLIGLAAFLQTPLAGCLYQAQDLLRDALHFQVSRFFRAAPADALARAAILQDGCTAIAVSGTLRFPVLSVCLT